MDGKYSDMEKCSYNGNALNAFQNVRVENVDTTDNRHWWTKYLKTKSFIRLWIVEYNISFFSHFCLIVYDNELTNDTQSDGGMREKFSVPIRQPSYSYPTIVFPFKMEREKVHTKYIIGWMGLSILCEIIIVSLENRSWLISFRSENFFFFFIIIFSIFVIFFLPSICAEW